MAKEKVTIKEYERRRAEWIKALESGKYKQTRHRLAAPHQGKKPSFCCLGVACDINKKTLDLKVKRIGDEIFYNETDLTLPTKVAEYLGFRRDEKGVQPVKYSGEFSKPLKVYAVTAFGEHIGREVINLTVANDTVGLTFKQIAHIIRHFPHLLFKRGTFRKPKPMTAAQKRKLLTFKD